MTKDRKITASANDIFVFAEDLPSRRRSTSVPSGGTRRAKAGTRPSRKSARNVAQRQKEAREAKGKGCGCLAMVILAIVVGASGFSIGTLAQAATGITLSERTTYAAAPAAVRDFTF